MNNNQSGTNTILLVIIIIAIVAGLVWFYDRNMTAAPAEAPEENGATINVTLPGGDETNTESTEPAT